MRYFILGALNDFSALGRLGLALMGAVTTGTGAGDIGTGMLSVYTASP